MYVFPNVSSFCDHLQEVCLGRRRRLTAMDSVDGGRHGMDTDSDPPTLDLPTAAIQLPDGGRVQFDIVSQEHKRLVLFVLSADAANSSPRRGFKTQS